MASKAAIAIRDEQFRSDTTKLLYALCKKSGINVRDVLSGELPDFSEPVEADGADLDLEAMNFVQLKETADRYGVAYEGTATKAQLREQLRVYFEGQSKK